MSTPTPTPAPMTPQPPGATSTGARGPSKSSEIKLISHSNLFYWWPVWALAFFLSTWTYLEGNRLAVLPPHGAVAHDADGYTVKYKSKTGEETRTTAQLVQAEANTRTTAGVEPFGPRVSQHTWPGTVFCFVLLITVVVTNVPLRGLWSAIVLVTLVFLIILFAFFGWWDDIFRGVENLRIHINLAGYLFIGIGIFGLWAMATYFFDRRSYVVFTPGQIRYCEHIGASVQTYSTMGVSLEKQRDDVFRHYIFGFGSGDLILKFSTGDRREIRLPTVLGIGSRLKTVEDMIRTMSTAG